jgi:hypothetical protein
LTEKQIKFKRAKAPAKLAFNPNMSLSNEVASLALNYFHTKEAWYLDEIKSVLKAICDEQLVSTITDSIQSHKEESQMSIAYSPPCT